MEFIPLAPGFSEVIFLISGLDGMGADGQGAHAPGESVELDSMPMLTKRAAILIYRLTRP
jgi:glutamate carboxypeptidase